MQIQAIKTRIFKKDENLNSFIFQHVKSLKENSILVITSKILALSEGRVGKYENEKQKEDIIKRESDFALETKYAWLTIKDGVVMANAGIDESNVGSQLGNIIFLPKDSFISASKIRKVLLKKFQIKNLGILITDSRLFPLRLGVVGFALGYAGFEGLRNYVGKEDIFGRKFKMSKVNIADSLATSATLCMGEGNEQQPLAVISDAPVVFTNKKVNEKELKINLKEDIYAPLFNNINKIKKIKK